MLSKLLSSDLDHRELVDWKKNKIIEGQDPGAERIDGGVSQNGNWRKYLKEKGRRKYSKEEN